MSITKDTIKETIKTIMAEEGDYKAFFKKALEKAGKSIPSMSDEEKKKFFNKIDAAWDGKGEKNEGNAFGAAVVAAKEAGEDEFEVDGEKFKVEESVNEAKPKLNGNQIMEKLAKKSKSFKDFVKAMYNESSFRNSKYWRFRQDKAILDWFQKVYNSVNESVNEAKNDNLYVVIDFHEKGGGFVMTKPSSKKLADDSARSITKTRDITKREVLKVKDARKIRGLAGKEYLKEESVNEAKKTDQWTLDVIDHLEYLKYPKKDIDYIMDFEKKKIKGWKRQKVHPTTVGQQLNIILKKLRRNEAIESHSDCGCGCGGVTEGGCNTKSVTEARLGKVLLLKDVEKGKTSSVEGVKLSKDLAFEIRTFLERPMLSRSRTGIKLDNSQMGDVIPMLAKIGIHKRLSSTVKQEFADLLKKYK